MYTEQFSLPIFDSDSSVEKCKLNRKNNCYEVDATKGNLILNILLTYFFQITFPIV
jgi:hypothetical protein